MIAREELPWFEPTECLPGRTLHFSVPMRLVEDGDPIPDPDVHWLTDTLADPPPMPPAIVQDLIRQGERVVIGAPHGRFKSWTVAKLALDLARGDGLFLGTFPIVAPQRVLIVHGELDHPTSASRWDRLLDGDPPPRGLGEVFKPLRVRVGRRRRHVGPDVFEDRFARLDDDLERLVERHEIGVLMIDPWATFFTGEENSNPDVEAALAEIAALQARHDLTVVLVHHFRQTRGGSDPEDQWRGATRLPDWASTRITLDPTHKVANANEKAIGRIDARRYAVARFLIRRGPTPEDFGIEFNLDTMAWGPWEDWAAENGAGGGKLTAQLVAAKCREAGGFTSKNQAAELCGVAPATVRKALQEAERMGLVKRKIVGQRHGYVPAADDDGWGTTS